MPNEKCSCARCIYEAYGIPDAMSGPVAAAEFASALIAVGLMNREEFDRLIGLHGPKSIQLSKRVLEIIEQKKLAVFKAIVVIDTATGKQLDSSCRAACGNQSSKMPALQPSRN